MQDLLLTFYGDDFTGSTDVMEALTLHGVPTVLFLEPPTMDFVEERFPNMRALGVAGVSRSMTPEQMDDELPPKFEALKAFGAPLFHYKICSTFDSSPTIGSIGHATEIGFEIFAPRVVPMMVGAPALKRYMAFGNLFAVAHGEVFRLDRHPTMSKHPATPMDESDLRLHLAKQTSRRIALIDVLDLAQPVDAIQQQFNELVADGAEIIFFDTMDDNHLLTIGHILWQQRGEKPLFITASSGVEYALTAYWQSVGIAEQPPPPPSPGPVEQLVVISGSASTATAEQIQWAIDNEFVPLRLDAARLIDPDTADATREQHIADALAALSAGRNVLLYSAQGPEDPAIAATNGHINRIGLDPRSIGARLGTQQGQMLRTILERTDLTRVCVAGGDTCGHAAHQLGIYALEMVIPVAPGSPLCRAYSHRPRFDGLEISLKAGPVGKADYFGSILWGEAQDSMNRKG
ncbi:MAG: four-carbon acid sugar kinase family protein [Chloroflexi bacterium]|nr:MAG: four-carbon acid sugar kinase family protein [Chloroflexota bacterium]